MNKKTSEDDFSLDEILAEFGVDDVDNNEKPHAKEESPAEKPDIDDSVYTPVTDLTPQLIEEVPAEKLSEILSMEKSLDENEGDLKGNPFEPLPSDKEPERDWEGESVEPTPEGGLELRAKQRKKKTKSKTDEIELYEDKIPLPKAVKEYTKKVKSIWPRILISIPLCLMSVYITIANAFCFPNIPGLDLNLMKWVLIGINAAVALLCLEVFAEGIVSLLKMRFTVQFGVLASTAVVIVHALIGLGEGQLPYCAVTTAAFLFIQMGGYYKNSAIRKTLKTSSNGTENQTIIRQDDGYDGKAAFFKTAGEIDGFVAMTEADNCAEKAFAIYIPAVIAASVVFAGLCIVLKKGDGLGCLAACLAVGIPTAGTLCFNLPYEILAGRLSSLGAALGGWVGASAMAGQAAVIVTDKDLFPTKNITMESIKLYGDFETSRVVGSATALIVASGSCLSELFKDKLESERGVMPFIDVFQTYEGGGLSSEINGSLVFVGTAGFIQLQNIRMPPGNRTKNGVYVAINGQLAGLFTIKYKAPKATAYTLKSMLRADGLKVVMATRDFNITKAFMRSSFNVNCDELYFPVIESRVDLSEPETLRNGRRAAIAAKDGLTPFGDAVTGGRLLHKLARFNTVFTMVGGVLGMLLMFYLSFTGAAAVSVAGYVLIYSLAWTLPIMLVSAWADKY